MPETQSVSHDDLAVCACGGKDYKARDAIDAAIFCGQLEPSWQGFLRRIKAEERAEELELDIENAVLDSAAEAFRYQHDLITAEETEHWLASRGLSLDDFADYFARQYWPDALGEEVEPDDVELVAVAPELRELFVAELILSDQLNGLTMDLMCRLAAVAAGENPDADAVAAERQTFLDRHKISAAELADWLGRLGRDPQWFDDTVLMEAAYRRRREVLLDPKARKRELSLMRLPLTRFEAEVIEVESQDAAREALFCIREDGMSMEEVAAEARYPYRTLTFLREEVPPDLQQKFLSVAVGDILDPVAHGDGFQLLRITNKVEPDPTDPAVQERIDGRLVERHFSDLTSKYTEPRLSLVSS